MTCRPDCLVPSPTQAHCGSSCHRTFGSVRAFDEHRRVKGREGECVDPATLGMEPNARGIWRHPMPPEVIARLPQKVRKSRAATETLIPGT